MDDVGRLGYSTQRIHSGDDGDANTCLPFHRVRSGLHAENNLKAIWCFRQEIVGLVSQEIVGC